MGVSVFALSLALTSCGPTAYYVRHLEIDSTLHIRPIGALTVVPETPEGSSYFFFHTKRIVEVDHFFRPPGSERRERLLYLETDTDLLLDRTVKHDEILKGPYGTLYATKTCFCKRPVESNYSDISAGSYINELGHEIPVELSSPPEKLPPLTSISIVRIFEADPEYVVVSANYEPDGKLGSLHVDKTKGGDWVSGVSMVHSDQESSGQEQAAIEVYGVSRVIDNEQYLRSRRLTIPPAKFSEVVCLVNEHYGYNKIIRQDQISLGRAISSRFLQPSITEEEQSLNPVCEARFRQQQAAKLRTVD